jgi:hypothetical protein
MKNLSYIAAGVLAVALASGITCAAVSLPENGTHYTAAQVKRMVREAHTPDQYRALARYYEERQSEFSQKAAEQMEEWERRSQNVTGPAAKFPRPVDVARNLYEYYAHEADDSAFQADKYTRFAEGAAALTKR